MAISKKAKAPPKLATNSPKPSGNGYVQFSWEEDKESETLQDLKANPDDKDTQELAVQEIKRYVKKIPEQEQTLAELLEKLQQSGVQPATTQIKQIHYGSGDNVGRDKIVNP